MWDGRKFTGPRLSELMFPATWATAPLPQAKPKGKGRPPNPTYFARAALLTDFRAADVNKYRVQPDDLHEPDI